MGTRGESELLTVLPPAAVDAARAVLDGVGELAGLRSSVFSPGEVRALGEFWARVAGRVDAARLGVLAAIDARDDVIPKARTGQASAVFAEHVLGQRRRQARRDGLWACLLRAEGGDLPAMGAAYAAGDVSCAHVEVAVRAHQRLGLTVREQLIDARLPVPSQDGDGDAGTPPGVAQALGALSGGFTRVVRQVLVVDAVLAGYARVLSVPEFAAVAERIVEVLNPPTLSRAHERRYLHLSTLPDGSWVGRFACGAAQGLLLKAALAAGSGPRPGRAIDPDGVEHDIPDLRDLGARQIDALTDLVKTALARNGITLPTDLPTDLPTEQHDDTGPDSDSDADPADDTADNSQDTTSNTAAATTGHTDPGTGSAAGPVPSWTGAEFEDEAPPGEGEEVVLREPGVLHGPYPTVDFTLIAGIEHAAAALAADLTCPGQLPLDLATAAHEALRSRLQPRRAVHEPPSAPPGEEAEQPDQGHDLDWLPRALSPYTVPARLEHAGPVDPVTLGLLACAATIRTALLTEPLWVP